MTNFLNEFSGYIFLFVSFNFKPMTESKWQMWYFFFAFVLFVWVLFFVELVRSAGIGSETIQSSLYWKHYTTVYRLTTSILTKFLSWHTFRQHDGGAIYINNTKPSTEHDTRMDWCFGSLFVRVWMFAIFLFNAHTHTQANHHVRERQENHFDTNDTCRRSNLFESSKTFVCLVKGQSAAKWKCEC